MIRILRVFPRRTSHTPQDNLVAIGEPGLFLPDADEVHVSVAFTWDVEAGKRLQRAWSKYYPVVNLGGPAIDGEGDEFKPGVYLKQGITITTRGCPNQCSWCLVGGGFREIGIKPGHVIQDNNVLAASKRHFQQVIEMLLKQRKAANFRGGLESDRLTDWHTEQLRRLRSIEELWFACDTTGALGTLKKALDRLRWLPRRKLRCYVLCAYAGQTVDRARARLEAVWGAGALPFAQLYQPPGHWIEYSREWKALAREWSRPAIMFANHSAQRR